MIRIILYNNYKSGTFLNNYFKKVVLMDDSEDEVKFNRFDDHFSHNFITNNDDNFIKENFRIILS